jgi:peptidoglycan/LPS O-acetylase OafA/YrhL
MSADGSYRPDIDGLRAVAVLSVVFYHFGARFFPGGFTGVDVFFVISGFLITSIIRREVVAGEFTFATFYRRRVRRIVPALAAVLIVSTIVAGVLLYPIHFRKFGESAVFSGLGLANFYYYLNTGYFDQAAEDLPLLHTWSLAIEEQFYLFWPIALLLLARSRQNFDRNTRIFLGGVILVSFVAAEVVLPGNSNAAFFLPHLRAWELGLGALVAFLAKIRQRFAAEALSTVGLGLIAWGICGLTAEDSFPGHNALFPCVGAALLVWPKVHETWAARLLSLRPAVWIGLISYSLYLWHWPLLVFFRYWNNDRPPGGSGILLLTAVAIAAAALSWFFIERPFRRTARGLSLPWPAALAGLGAAIFAGGAVALARGMPSRVPENLRQLESYLDYGLLDVPADVCKYEGDDRYDAGASCLQGVNGRRRVLVLGDSHAMHYFPALVQAFPQIHFSASMASQCRPVIAPRGKETCVAQMQAAYQDVVSRGDFDAVILSARWNNGDADQIRKSVEYLRRYTSNVIVFGQIAEYRTSLPEILLGGTLPRRRVSSLKEASIVPQLRALNVKVGEDARAAGAAFYDPLEALCGQGSECVTRNADGVPVQFDYGHLTNEGARYILDRFARDGLFSGL